MLNAAEIELAANTLYQRRLLGVQAGRLPSKCRPQELESALAIQTRVSSLMGAPITAWKCGLPSVDKLVAGPIYASTVRNQSPCELRVPNGVALVEPEVAFVLKTALAPRAQPYTVAEIDAAIGGAQIALELIGGRFTANAAPSFAEKLADGLVNQGLYLGPEIPLAMARIAATLAVHISIGTQATQHYSGQHPNGAPLAPLYWLVNFMRLRGQTLQAGDAIITGSYAGTIALPLNETIEIDYVGFAKFCIRFVSQ